ncbi:hypothetical protein ACU4GG_40845 [Streptomyces nojiriensis]
MGTALLVGDAAADDIHVVPGAEASDHERGDARELARPVSCCKVSFSAATYRACSSPAARSGRNQ